MTAVAQPELTLTLNRASVVESAGADAATLTIARSGPPSNNPITIQLSSNDNSEITVPATATIAPGTSSVTVPVTAVDDTLLDGSQTVTLTASAASTVSDSITMTVTDEESLTATFTAESIREDAAAGSFFLTVSRSNTDTSAALTVALLGNAPEQFTLPLSIVIPAGQQTIQVPVVPINDSIAEAPFTAKIRFVATGYVQPTAILLLIDDETPKFQNPEDIYDVSNDGVVTPLDALRIINAIARRPRGTAQLDPNVDSFGDNFVDVSGDYLLTALDALRVVNEIARRRNPPLSSGEAALQTASAEMMNRLSVQDEALTTLTESSIF